MVAVLLTYTKNELRKKKRRRMASKIISTFLIFLTLFFPGLPGAHWATMYGCLRLIRPHYYYIIILINNDDGMMSHRWGGSKGMIIVGIG